MTKFKVGDRVKLVEVGGSVPISFGYKVGDIASIVEIRDAMTIVIEMDNGPKGGRELLICSHEIEAASPTTPPATIQHEGYSYTRGEPVVPEWVKDGAWVVEKETGDVMCLSVSKYAVKAINMNGQLKWYGGDKKTASVSFRPFTNEDWKWGMWAEYKGEKVFVSGAVDHEGVSASKPGNGYFFIPFSKITPTTAP